MKCQMCGVNEIPEDYHSPEIIHYNYDGQEICKDCYEQRKTVFLREGMTADQRNPTNVLLEQILRELRTITRCIRNLR